MPQVPRITKQTRTAPAPGPQLATPGNVGGEIARGISQLGSAIVKIARNAKRDADNTRLQEVGRNSTQSANEALVKYEDEFKLQDASEFTDAALASYKASNERLLLGISDEDVRERARSTTSKNEIMFENGLQRYAKKERAAFKESVFESSVAANRDEALINRSDVGKFGLTAGKIRESFDLRYEGEKTPEEIDVLAKKEIGRTAAQNVISLINDKDFATAERYMKIGEMEERMPPGVFQKLNEGITNGKAVVEAEVYSAEKIQEAADKNLTGRADMLQMISDARDKFKYNPTAANNAVDNIREDFALRDAVKTEAVKLDFDTKLQSITTAGNRGAALKIAQLADPLNQFRLKQLALKRYPLNAREARSQIDIPAQERKIALARRMIQDGDILTNDDLAAKFSDLSKTDSNALESFLQGVKSQDRPNEIYKATEAAMTRMRKGKKPGATALDRTWRSVMAAIGRDEITPDKLNSLVAVSLMNGDVVGPNGRDQTGTSGLDALEDEDKFRFFLPDIRSDKELATIKEQAAAQGVELNPPGEPDPDFEERKFLREKILGLSAFGTSPQDQQRIRRASTSRAFEAKQREDIRALRTNEAVVGVKKVLDQESFSIENPEDPSSPHQVFGVDALLLTLENEIRNNRNPEWLEQALVKIPSRVNPDRNMLDDLDFLAANGTSEEIDAERRRLGEQFINRARE